MNDELPVVMDRSDYDEMQADLRWLRALEAAGVDNWEGYDHAREIFSEFQARARG